MIKNTIALYSFIFLWQLLSKLKQVLNQPEANMVTLWPIPLRDSVIETNHL